MAQNYEIERLDMEALRPHLEGEVVEGACAAWGKAGLKSDLGHVGAQCCSPPGDLQSPSTRIDARHPRYLPTRQVASRKTATWSIRSHRACRGLEHRLR